MSRTKCLTHQLRARLFFTFASLASQHSAISYFPIMLTITIPNMKHHQQLPSNYCNLLHPSRPFCRSSFALCGLFAQESANQRHRALQPLSSPNGGTAGQQIGRQARAELSTKSKEITRQDSSINSPPIIIPSSRYLTRYQIDYNRDLSDALPTRIVFAVSFIRRLRRRDYPCLAIEAETI